ncbi:MAG TPA: phosphotransferase [Gaiellales bacterium]|nr:phosphotransferase [Gaiellales bacterium]
MPEWAADTTVDAARARRLIGRCFPALATAALEPLGEGWDVTAWLVGGSWVFRFPRREVVVPGFRRELELLPRLAPLLPIAVPVPELIGDPGCGYPWPFAGARHLPGVELAGADLDVPARAAVGRSLGEYLRALHAVDPGFGGSILLDDPLERGHPAARADRLSERLGELVRCGLWQAPTALVRTLDRANRLPRPRPEAIVHGDLHVRQVLVAGGRAAGVIDWVDVCRGDPGLDLALYWAGFDPPARAGFLAAYGDVAEHSMLRARSLAVYLSAALAAYAHAERLGALLVGALAALDRCAAD